MPHLYVDAHVGDAQQCCPDPAVTNSCSLSNGGCRWGPCAELGCLAGAVEFVDVNGYWNLHIDIYTYNAVYRIHIIHTYIHTYTHTCIQI